MPRSAKTPNILRQAAGAHGWGGLLGGNRRRMNTKEIAVPLDPAL